MPQADCVVKSAAWKNPALRWVLRAAGYVRNDGGSALVDDCVARGLWSLARVFPEGTRSPSRRLGPRTAARRTWPCGRRRRCCPSRHLRAAHTDEGPEVVRRAQPTAQFTVQVSEPITATDVPAPASAAWSPAS
jgi:hypothetical protein